MKKKITIFLFRRDLRLIDNKALTKALEENENVLPVYIFDTDINRNRIKNDARISFVYQSLSNINSELEKYGSGIKYMIGSPQESIKKLLVDFDIKNVYANKDYEPYELKRDREIENILSQHNINFKKYKDQVIFEEKEILKSTGDAYTIFTPYKNKWLEKFSFDEIKNAGELKFNNFEKTRQHFPSIEETGYTKSTIIVRNFDLSTVENYDKHRDFPAADATSYLSPHLRYGTISVRDILRKTYGKNSTFLSELIWREFFKQILFNFPETENNNFKRKYDNIEWLNNEDDFEKWSSGNTGYPLVDAGMRQLNTTGYMHNRLRMITAGFLCKHLLIDWRYGEKYFSEKLLDFDLSANNGNWQWAAGTGCDAAPYFRVFNPIIQLKKFDANLEFVKAMIPELGTPDYPSPIVEHKFAYQRALSTYKRGIENK